MKRFALCLCLATGLLVADERPGNFTIRVQPTAVLQTEAPIPFQIQVTDALRKPLVDATVTLQIETPDHEKVQIFKAPAVSNGIYVAKPVFPTPGTWSVLVQVHRSDQVSSRTDEYNVPVTAQ